MADLEFALSSNYRRAKGQSRPRGGFTVKTTHIFRRALPLLCLAPAYLALIHAGPHLTLYDQVGPPVAWPASGLLLAAFILIEPRGWPALFTVAGGCIAAALHLANLPLTNVFVITPFVCGPLALGAALLRRARGRTAADEVRATTLVMIGGFLVPAVISSCFTIYYVLTHGGYPGRLYVTPMNDGALNFWRARFAGPSLGIVTITPFLVSAASSLKRGTRRVFTRALIWDALILAAACAVAFAAFESEALPIELRSPSIVMPFMVLISLRGKLTLTTMANLIVSWIMIGATLRNHGAFALFFANPAARTTVLQVFVTANVLSQTIFTTIIAGRAKLAASLRARGEDLERLNQDLLRAQAAAARADAAKSRVLAHVAHEIRTPLGAMIGFAELALGEDDPVKKDKYVGTVHRNGIQLNHLVNDALDLAKIESGQFNIDARSLDVRELTDEVVELMQVRAREKNLSLSIRYSPKVYATFCSDPLRVRQVLMNLIGNAIKFTARGRVLVRVAPGPTRHGRRSLMFHVEDTGIGLSEVERAELFQPYRQANAATARTYGGTGLGLSLSRELARLLGGDVTLAGSAPGVGSTFEFRVTEWATAHVGKADPHARPLDH